MNNFDDREKTFERKFAQDEDLRFRASVRRNKLVGLWAAAEFGLAGDAAEAYAKDVIAADFEEAGDDDVVRKLLADFRSHDIEMTDHTIRRRLVECMDEARAMLMASETDRE